VLRLIAGFLAPDEGSVLIANREVAAQGRIEVPPEHRNLAMVFQDLAFWPHLTVYRNLEFALKAQGLKKEARERRIREALGRVRLEDYPDAYPVNCPEASNNAWPSRAPWSRNQ
jgi:iron(III) transport system ATP-binding protein